jgi:ABC-type transport system involved in cytochrome bd biosynthesis fused ATPase/permease subunit
VIGLLPILARWRVGLSIAGALAVFGLIVASWHYRHAYHAEKALRKAQEAAYAAAQSEATVIAKRALDAAEARYKRNADNADQAFQSKLADARRFADQYVLTHRVHGAFASSTGRAPSAAEGDRAASPDRAGTAPDMVAVTPDDIQVCTDNTLRLEAAHNWALTLAKP